jgi:peptidyl-prolyl cis-trans isomerase-like 3
MSLTLHTNYGDIKVELNCEDTPRTCPFLPHTDSSSSSPYAPTGWLAGWLIDWLTDRLADRPTDGLDHVLTGALTVFHSATGRNFLGLAAAGVYDDTKFHRNIKGFMIQGGDPEGTGKGGVSIYGGKFKDEIVPTLKHSKRGVLSMANSGKDTNTSQFFITYRPHNHLNGKYTVFGSVIDGLEVLDKLERIPSDDAGRPLQDIIISGVTIHANPLA